MLNQNSPMRSSNRKRAEDYADVVQHNTVYFSAKFSILKWIHNKRFRSISILLGDTRDKVILDAGSGEGFFLSQLEAKEKYGVEISEKRLRRSLKQFSDLNIVQGDVKNLPYGKHKFDIIVCSEVLEHVDSYQQAISEFKRCLKPTGKLILSFPNEYTVAISRALILRLPAHEPDHVNWISVNDVRKYISEKFISKNVPNISYPFCLYQVYCFKANELN